MNNSLRNRILPTMVAMLVTGVAGAATHSLGISSQIKGESIAFDMNNAGQVAAVIVDESGNQHAVLFEHGTLLEIGDLGGKDSEAKHINDKGQVIGSSNQKNGLWRAYLYDRTNGMQILDTLGGPNGHGTALNNAGAAVGFADTANGEWHAFLYEPGEQIKDLGTLGGKISYASGINAHGQVVGGATDPSGHRHAFLYDAMHGMTDLGTLGGRSSYASSINDLGVVVGSSEMPNGSWHAFVFDGKQMTDLGVKMGHGDSFASGINNAGHVVGTYIRGQDQMSFVWRDNKVTLHFGGAKGLYLTNAINNTEQVVGATYDRGFDAATMLSSAVPYVDHGGSTLLSRIALVLLMAGTAVLSRRSYRGILLSGYADLRAWLRQD